MGLYTELPDDISEVDVIIAGGGTAGCVVAARLAEASPEGFSILVVEGGPDNDLPSIKYPLLFGGNLIPATKAMIFYQANKSSHIADRAPFVPSGGVFGGGSSANLMMYSRAQRSDFDAWGMPGWSADEMLPYLKKLETYHGNDPEDRHGRSGPIHVSDGTYRAIRPQEDFIAAAKKVGWEETEDLQSLDASNKVSRAKKYISPDGKRQDTASRYLRPLLEDGKHPDLHVLLKHQVVRVLLDGNKAVGVEFSPNPEFQPQVPGVPSVVRSVKARKMVIVSCGAIGTPLVLERSGVGSPEVLSRAGVPVVADVPGVGEGYQDHELMVYAYRTSLDPSETLDALAGGRLDVGALIASNDKLLGWNAQDITSKLRPSAAAVAALGPDFQAAWDRDYRDNPNRPLMIMSPVNTMPRTRTTPSGPATAAPAAQYYSISAFTAYPYSRGHVHITNPTTITGPLDFDPGFLSDPLDVKKHLWAYKAQREIARRMAIFRGEWAPLHPAFAPDSSAACVELDAPLDGEVRDVEYSAADDAAIEAWVREHASTTWHSLGTCKMGTREAAGVVDARLRVFGVEGLRLADLSVVPGNVASNTNNTAIAVGERAADIFGEDLGLL
ncbi:putative glucose dehydrogenase [Lasiosphaeria hispida]|uniref:Glucose dehydrogenase n=1 Tax=Lasiosphaeria hispida TaxID=260671 RepID=A0AAJ0MA85_9PEZI|nr:putative glucose dehydrogenase [Lasiosphaeria hispida]